MTLLRRNPTHAIAHRAMPWLTTLDVLRATRAHWSEHLSAQDRKRLTELITKSHGRPGHLKPGERRDVRRLIAQLDLRALAKTAALTVTAGTPKQANKRS